MNKIVTSIVKIEVTNYVCIKYNYRLPYIHIHTPLIMSHLCDIFSLFQLQQTPTFLKHIVFLNTLLISYSYNLSFRGRKMRNKNTMLGLT
jgi:hypothetical protein